jgi:hypothetical protein
MREVREGRFRPPEIVASFWSFEEAARAVDFLADRRVPLTDIAVVARDFRLAERPGRRTLALAGAHAILPGGLIAALAVLSLHGLGIVWMLGSPILVAFAAFAAGAAFAVAAATADFGMRRTRDGRRAVRAIGAERYDVIVHGVVADAARRFVSEFLQRTRA